MKRRNFFAATAVGAGAVLLGSTGRALAEDRPKESRGQTTNARSAVRSSRSLFPASLRRWFIATHR